jgi:hypothetical protein
MAEAKNITRREVIVGTIAAVGAAILPSAALAQSDEAAVDAFYAGQKYTYCDARVLADFWGEEIWEAKIGAGQMILQQQESRLNQKLKNAARTWTQNGNSCEFEDVDNPPYSYEDAQSLAAFWGGDMTPYEAKMKIVLNVEGGGNSWVLGELAKAR